MIRFRRAAQPAPAAQVRRPMNPAWSADRPLPTPSNDWVDSKMGHSDADTAPLTLNGPRGGESGKNIRSL